MQKKLRKKNIRWLEEEKKPIDKRNGKLKLEAMIATVKNIKGWKSCPCMKEGRNTDQKNIELWGSVAKVKNHTYFNNSEHISLQHLNATVVFDVNGQI